MLTQTKICTMHWSTICKSLSQRIGKFDALFAEDAILNMCKRFQLPGEHHDINSGFREFKLELGRITPKSLQPLIRSSETLIVSTAECERAFSSMNKILTDTRNQLKVARVSALRFAKIVGPPLICIQANALRKVNDLVRQKMCR